MANRLYKLKLKGICEVALKVKFCLEGDKKLKIGNQNFPSLRYYLVHCF